MYIALFCYKQDSNYQRIGHSGREHIVNLSRNPKFYKKTYDTYLIIFTGIWFVWCCPRFGYNSAFSSIDRFSDDWDIIAGIVILSWNTIQKSRKKLPLMIKNIIALKLNEIT